MTQLDWPVLLLVTRIAVVVALYLFVLVAVSALRDEIRSRTMPSLVPAAEDAGYESLEAPAEPSATASAEGAHSTHDERIEPVDAPEPAVAMRRSPWALLAPVSVAIPLLLVGAMVLVLRSGSIPLEPGSRPASPSTAQSLPTPAPGRVAVSLSAAEDSSVRVTIDGTVQFEGTMRPGERRNWDAGSVLSVWTDKGKTLGIAVDGRDLGPYSPAMGHADWNRIEYSFWPGWSQSLPR